MGFNFKTVDETVISPGATVLLRLDLNLPIVGGQVRDDFRLRRSLPTLQHLVGRRARTVILAHTDSQETDSLKLVAEHLNQFVSLKFVPSLAELPGSLKTLEPGGVLFLENLRRDPGEVADNPDFAKTLASFGDVYVNDAFSVSHRAHASIVGIPKFLPSYAGFLLAEEAARLARAFKAPRPFVFVLAGAKFETKLPLVKKFLRSADSVFIGGALANDLFKVQGREIGLSKHSEADFGFAGVLQSPKLILPVDVVAENAGKRATKKPAEVLPGDNILDAGPETLALLAEKFASAKFILWNGTLGVYEKGFAAGTEALAKAIVASSAETIVGGGDTLACISKINVLDKFSFVSTGGGAMLDFLANETLPGIEALENSV
ncbi:MAG: phosphoglycerate kinase [Candidatus Taylorbacteria bacterium]|nr:phosphoglycerate kinase [Candidatus Taylorbacteria bacterium]